MVLLPLPARRKRALAGATALWVATDGNATLVKRLGRWSSDAVNAYLWDLPTMGKDLPRKMVEAKATVPWGAVYSKLVE